MEGTVKGGFWEKNGVSLLVSCDTTRPVRRIAAQALNKRGNFGNRQSMFALNGIAPGGAISKNLTRVAHSQELGGVRAIETEVIVSGVTTSGVRDQINRNFLTFTTNTTFGATPPPNLDGNPLGTR